MRSRFFLALTGVLLLLTSTPNTQQHSDSAEEAVLRAAIERSLKEVPTVVGTLQAPSEVGVHLNDLQIATTPTGGRRVTIDLSQKALTYAPSDNVEVLVDHIFAGTARLTADWAGVEFRFLIDGLPLEQLLSRAADTGRVSPRAVGVRNRVVVSPGHGWYFYESASEWRLQRAYFWGIVEDYVNWDIAKYVQGELAAASFEVRTARYPDRTSSYGSTGHPKWQESGKYYIRDVGAPSSVWSYGGSDLDRDIDSRPLYANWTDSAAIVSIHNNGGSGTGTETWYDNSNGQEAESRRLAELVNAKVVAAIRSRYNGNWPDRNVRSCNGCKGENRLATRPAIIIEIAFMDTKSPDNDALHDEAFKQIVAQAIREGVLEWSGNPQPDRTQPSITSFSVTPTSVNSGGSFSISFTTSDAGGSGLNRVELWRREDSGNWAVVRQVNVSGNGPVSGSFADAPPVGAYWYGMHAVDNAGNWSVEPNPPGPIHVTVTAVSNPPPGTTNNLDAQARNDMLARATRDSRFGASDYSSFGSDPNWDQSWMLRWMNFQFSGGRIVTMYHATYKFDTSQRLILFWDPDRNGWVGWERP